MPTGLMIGPYARQLVVSAYTVAGPVGPDLALGRLKFWFAFRSNRSLNVTRYEAMIGKGDKVLAMKKRPYYGTTAPKYGANFHAYKLPEDLTPFPSLELTKGETLANIAFALLRDEDIADVTRMRLLGALPTRPAWHIKPETDPCTSKQPLLI